MTATLSPPHASQQPRDSPGRRARVLWLIPAAAFLVVLAPVVLFAGAGNLTCQPVAVSTTPGSARGGMFAEPLDMQPDHWYQVGATEYGGPSDPGSGDYGSSGAYLPAYPDSFAELSLLNSDPANGGGSLTFGDANALSNLPYGTAVRVANGSRQQLLVKRDIGYGQGPDQTIPYRLDVWYRAASRLGITKTSVDIELAPASGTGATLGQLPATTSAGGASGCPSSSAPLTLTPGQTAQILPNGEATAPQDAPAAVKQAIAAGNELISKPYLYGGGHGQPLTTLADSYDCSSATSYILFGGGLFAEWPQDSTELETYGQRGPGQWISVYANSAHAFIEVAGVVMDTAWYAPVNPTTPSSGPRWQPASIIAAQYAGDEAAGDGGFVERHPKGL
jgi:hypothetical protein